MQTGVVEKLADVVTESAEETLALGRSWAERLRPPCVVLLEGDLGSGKTTLTKGIVTGLGAAREEDVTSPTFTLIHEYSGNCKVYHVDLYRIEGARDIATLGLQDLMEDRATVIIEWAERLGPDLPVPRTRIVLEHLGGDRRKITLERELA